MKAFAYVFAVFRTTSPITAWATGFSWKNIFQVYRAISYIHNGGCDVPFLLFSKVFFVKRKINQTNNRYYFFSV
jgi:hypothetical protein